MKPYSTTDQNQSSTVWHKKIMNNQLSKNIESLKWKLLNRIFLKGKCILIEPVNTERLTLHQVVKLLDDSIKADKIMNICDDHREDYIIILEQPILKCEAKTKPTVRWRFSTHSVRRMIERYEVLRKQRIRSSLHMLTNDVIDMIETY